MLEGQSVQATLVTPEIAAKWLAEHTFERQRTLREGRVAYLADAIQTGTFDPSAITFIVCRETGRTILTNGQHRLNAIVRADTPALLYIIVRTLETDAEVRAAYAREDRGSSRSMNDVLKAHGLSEILDIPMGPLSRIAAAATFILTGFRCTGSVGNSVEAYSGDLRVAFLKEYATELRTYTACIEGATPTTWRRVLHAAPVAAVALVTLRHQNGRAATFWRVAAQNDGLRKGMPERALFDFLNSGSIQKIGRHRAARGTANCWNAAFQGRPLSLVKVLDDTAPILIAGTPFKGAR